MRRYGLIGKTLKHSFSKHYFTEKFIREQITNVSYENFEIPSIDKLSNLINNNKDIKGFNITIPYKEEILSYLNEKSPAVKDIGACNCVKVKDQKLYGYNTDAFGFIESIKPFLKPHYKKALVLGTGGASKAVQWALKQMNIEYLLVSRIKTSGKINYEDLGRDLLKDHFIIINTTPVGMFPDVFGEPTIPYEFITSDHLLYDLIYNPIKTRFLQKGEEKGAQILNGYNMLVLQAEESWKIWNSQSD